MNSDSIEKIKKLAQEVSDREGCVLYDIEFVGAGRHRTLRVLIDAKGGPVSIQQCADVSKGLSLMLDVEDAVPGGAYDLEVSSPGVERNLREPWHYTQAVGKTVSLHLHEPVPPIAGNSVKGVVKSANDDVVVVQVGETEVSYQPAQIKKAKILFEITPPNKKGTGKR
jgi:ribosome maturation factor RimP